MLFDDGFGGFGQDVSVLLTPVEISSITPGTGDGAVRFVAGSSPTAGEVSNEISISNGYSVETWAPVSGDGWELAAGPVSIESVAGSPELVATVPFNDGQDIVMSYVPPVGADPSEAAHVVVVLSFEFLGCDDSGNFCFVEWRASLFVNGQPVDSGSYGGLDSEVGSPIGAVIAFPTGVPLDETAIYDNDLTAARVEAHYNAAIDG